MKKNNDKVNIFNVFLLIGIIIGFLGDLFSHSLEEKTFFMLFILFYLVGVTIKKSTLFVLSISFTITFLLLKYLLFYNLPVNLWGIIVCGLINGFIWKDLFNDFFEVRIK